jgi:signal transduction histidine kinase
MGSANSHNYDVMTDRAAKPTRLGPKLVLIVGFGGVLLLTAIAGIDSLRVLHRLEEEHAALSRTYLEQFETLERIRSAVYLSGSAVRGFLLAEDAESAASRSARLRELQEQMNTALNDYSKYVEPSEQELYRKLGDEAGQYWQILSPILDWSPDRPAVEIREFLADEAPHRRRLATVVGRIDAVNQQVVEASGIRSSELFESFRRRIVAVLTSALCLGLALAAFSISHILRLEKEARVRYEEILGARTELAELSARLVATQEDERRSISRELHDEVGQSLSALLVDLGNLAATVPQDNPEVKEHLATAKRLAESTLGSVRNMALLLRPSMLDDFGLVPALHWQAREVSRRTGIKVSVDADCVPDELPDEYRTCVYRVIQEALHNTARHAAARTVRIAASLESGRLRLSVVDDGQGFDARSTRGMGLLGMEERVRHLGGEFRLSSRPGGGATISIELPLEAAAV